MKQLSNKIKCLEDEKKKSTRNLPDSPILLESDERGSDAVVILDR